MRMLDGGRDEPPEFKQYVQDRMVTMIHVGLSKMFLAGFFWEAFGAIFADNKYHTVKYALLTGLGDATGTFFGHLTYYSILQYLTLGMAMSETLVKEFRAARLLGTSALVVGCTWMPFVNLALDRLEFGLFGTIVFVGAASGLVFFVAIRCARFLYGGFNWPNYPVLDSAKIYFDVTLAIAVAGAEAMFVCTTPTRLMRTKMTLFTVTSNDGWPLASAKAGGSTLVGFLVVQTIQNLTVNYGYTWADPDTPVEPRAPVPIDPPKEREREQPKDDDQPTGAEAPLLSGAS